MAFPVVGSRNASVEAVNATSHTVALPASIAAGDLLLCVITSDGSSAIDSFPGWISIANVAGDPPQHAAFYRKATGSDPVLFTTAAGQMSAHRTWRFTSASVADPDTVGPQAGSATGAASNPDPPSFNPTWTSGDDTTWIATCGRDDDDSTAQTYPTNYDTGQFYHESGTANGSVEAAYAEDEVSTSGAEDPGNFDLGNTAEQWVALTIAIPPSGAVLPDATLTQTTGLVYEGGGAENTDVVSGGASPTLDTDIIYIVRLEVDETASVNQNLVGQLQRNWKSGGWVDVTDLSSVVKSSYDSGAITDKATTNRISSSAKTFQAGVHANNGRSSSIVDLNNEHTELTFSIEIIGADVLDAESLDFRVSNRTGLGEIEAWTQNITATINIPTRTLPGVVHNKWQGVQPESVGWAGPWADSNGNLYAITEVGIELSPTEPDPVMWKSANGGKLWTLMDMGPLQELENPIFRDIESIDSAVRQRVAPDTTGDVWWAKQSGTAGNVRMVRFFTSDHASLADTWELVGINESSTAQGDEPMSSIKERSDGGLIILYTQLISTFFRVVAKQQTVNDGSFSAEFNVDTGTASTNFTHGRMSLGASDRVCVVYFDGTNNSLHCRDIPDDSTTPGTVEADINGAQTVKNYTSASVMPIVDVMQYDADDDHLCIWLDNSDTLWAVKLEWDGSQFQAATPEQVSTRTVDTDFPSLVDTAGTHAQMAVDYDTGDVYVMYVDIANHDIYYNKWTVGGGWETEVKVYTSGGDTDRVSYVYPHVFTHSSGNGSAKVLGFIFTVFDITSGEATAVDGQQRYDEVVLVAGAAVYPPFPRRQNTLVRM